MNRYRTCPIAFLLFFSSWSWGAIIAEQDFNNLSSSYSQSTDSVVSGGLLTNSGSFSDADVGLNFSTQWHQTRSNGLGPSYGSDASDSVGVIAHDGDNDFIFSDGDGELQLVFEAVNLNGFKNRQLSLDYWVEDTGYESGDRFSVSVSDTIHSVDVLSYGDTDMESNAGAWLQLLINLESLISGGLNESSLVLAIIVDTNAAAESVYIDNILFSGDVITSVPEPSTPALLLVVILALGAQRLQAV